MKFSGCVAVIPRAIFLMLITVSTALAQTIPTTIEEFSSEFNIGATDRQAVHSVDGSGLNTGNNPPTHGTQPNGEMWLNTGDGSFGGGADPDRPSQLAHITFDLAGVQIVDSFRIWNYNEINAGNQQSFTDRGVQTMTVSTATSSGGPYSLLTDPSDSDTTFTLNQAPGTANYTGQLFSFATPFTAAFVRFDIKTNYGGANGFVGLSEVQFYAVPEPATLGLFAAGAVFFFIRRTRRRGRLL